MLLRKLFTAGLLAALLSLPAFASAPLYTIQGVISGDNESESLYRMVFKMDPGEDAQGEVLAKNLSDETISLSLFAVDAQTDASGNFTLRSRDNEQYLFGTWVELETDSVTLAPRESQVIPFSLDVPDTVTPGQYAGGLVVNFQEITTDELGGGGFVVGSQVGLRAYVDLAGEPEINLNWDEYTTGSKTENGRLLRYGLTNEGNTMLDVTAKVAVEGWLSESETLDVELGTIAPGEHIESEVEISLPMIDRLSVASTLNYQVSSAFSASTDVETFETEQREVAFFVLPWLYLGIVFFFAVLLIGFVLWHKREHARMVQTWKPYKVKKGDTIVELAAARGYNWKKLARVNKVSAPYVLTSGMTLLLPPKQKGNAKK